MSELFDMTSDRVGRLLDRLEATDGKSLAAQRQVLAAAVLMIPNEAIPQAAAAVVKALRKARGEKGGAA